MKRRTYLLAVIFAVFQLLMAGESALAAAQKPDSSAQAAGPTPQAPPAATKKEEAEPVPPGIIFRKCVVFLTAEVEVPSVGGPASPNRNVARNWIWVEQRDARIGQGQAFSYLVTNRHVISPLIDGVRAVPRRVSIQANLKDEVNGSFLLKAEIPISTFKWYYPDDPSVDLAITPLGLPQEEVDRTAIDRDIFVTEDDVKQHRIAEADPVVFAGFFLQYPGQKRIEPIVRRGILAMLPNEPIVFEDGTNARLYLADAHVFLGNSGSPMFINVSRVVGYDYRFLGVVSGYVFEDEDLTLHVATTFTGRVKANSGISTVVPAWQVGALLDSPDLKKLRDDYVAARSAHKSASPPTQPK